jgi:hypothetical protein
MLSRLQNWIVASSVDVSDLPSEVRLFRVGANETTKGTFLFDDVAAESVMSRYQEHAVDVMFDLEHLSLDSESQAFDPDSRGWCKLAVRNGELWAVDIHWNADGAERIRSKKQRYLSPAFAVDEDERIIEILNIALVAMPATHDAQALIEAKRNRMSENILLKAQKRIAVLNAQFVALADEMPSAESPAKGKVAQIVESMKGARAAIDEAEKALKGKDIDAIFDAMSNASEVMAAFQAALAAFNGTNGGAAEAAPESEPQPDSAMSAGCAPEDEAKKMSAREYDELIRLRAERAERIRKEKIEADTKEAQERLQLVSRLVSLGRETPATAWESDGEPKGYLKTMPIVDLRERVESFEKVPSVAAAAPKKPTGTIEATNHAQLGQYEEARVREYFARRHDENKALGLTPRSVEQALDIYIERKLSQRDGAKQLGKPIEQEHVLLDVRGRSLVTLGAVKPAETFGASSQRALEEFRLEYNMALASEPVAWAEQIGAMLPGGSLKTTFPLNFDAVRFTEKTAQNAPAVVAKNVDISVSKREFFAGKQVNLRRLVDGDFAYIQNWQQQARQMARARVLLRNALVTTLLESGTSTYWGQSAELATGIDGMYFFSATHAINPFDSNIKLRGVATWSNYQSSATPLNAGNLTTEKDYAFQVGLADGSELGYEYDLILHPSSLAETARNLLTVQDIILDANSSYKSVSNVMGAVRNPHFNSGMSAIRAGELAGTAVTANYYLVSRAAIAAGLTPWVLAEDAAEEIRNWDETSDFYLNTGNIKVESHVYCNAALLWPHGIRFIAGT